jgi:UPF0755 protein
VRKRLWLFLRGFFFVAALVSLIAILGVGIWYWHSQSDGGTLISIGDVPGGRQPQGVGDWALGFYLQLNAERINKPASDDPSPIHFRVEAGETAISIGTRLQEMGLITDVELFRRFLQYNGLDASLEAGDYVLRRNMSMREIGEALQHSKIEEVTVTIPEGWRAEQVAELLSKQEIMDGSVFLAAVRQGEAVQHPLLASKPAGMSYEGYLFPETYRLPIQPAPEDLLTRMLNTLQSRLPAAWESMATAQGLTFHQVLTLASIVEREAVIPDERPAIASVYLNRLKQGMYLNADPTVQYAMGYQPDSGQWWKTPVTIEEYQGVNSPYNTYLNPGLPPGPICSPGISAIMAVLQPANTDYLYFVARGDGGHVFARTMEEHEHNVQTYMGGQ